MTRYLVNAVMILGLTWFGSQAVRLHRADARVSATSIEQAEQAQMAH